MAKRERQSEEIITPAYVMAARDNVLGPMPRRRWLAELDRGPTELHAREKLRVEVSTFRKLARALLWLRALLTYLGARLLDRWRGDRSLAQHGVRLRELFERVGGTAVKIGQQLSVRVDFLPYEICRELGRLMDQMPAFPLEEARGAIEAAVQGSLEERFVAIEEEPIGAASIACVFAGRLRAPDGGEGLRVAIKVRRPKVEHQFAADLAIIDALTELPEALTLVRPGFFKNLRYDLRDMFMTELDFQQEANAQQLFRRLVKRDKLREVTAPEVLVHLSNSEVMISELIDGWSALEVLRAFETGDEAKLAELAEAGVVPSELGDKIMSVGYWFRMECFFFHADPHPGNFIVTSGGGLVLLDFGACGLNTRKNKGVEFELSRRFKRGDIAGVSTVGMLGLCPLPEIDVALLNKVVREVWWKRYIVLEARDGEWWERTTAMAWLAVFELARDFQLPVNADMLRLVRSVLLYDTLAFRLKPELDYGAAANRWYRQAIRRWQRREAKRREREATLLLAEQVAANDDMLELVERGGFWLDRFLEDLPRELHAKSTKASHVATLLLRLVFTSALIVLVGAIALLGYEWALGTFHFASIGLAPLWDRALAFLSNRVVLGLLLLLLYRTLTLIRRRLDEADR